MTRPNDPRAGKLCTACNRVKDAAPHCENRRCLWWKCRQCGAVNDETGSNNRTLRDGTPRTRRP